jgi:hypothetical protein
LEPEDVLPDEVDVVDDADVEVLDAEVALDTTDDAEVDALDDVDALGTSDDVDVDVLDAVDCDRATELTISPCRLLPVGALCAAALTTCP